MQNVRYRVKPRVCMAHGVDLSLRVNTMRPTIEIHQHSISYMQELLVSVKCTRYTIR